MKWKKAFADILLILRSNRPIVLGLKYIPVMSVVLLTIHTGLLLVGCHEILTVGLSAALLVLFMILLSIKFNFCLLHKAMIVYMALMTLCICLQRLDLFGESLTLFRVVMFAFGVVLAVLALTKGKDDGCCE